MLIKLLWNLKTLTEVGHMNTLHYIELNYIKTVKKYFQEHIIFISIFILRCNSLILYKHIKSATSVVFQSQNWYVLKLYVIGCSFIFLFMPQPYVFFRQASITIHGNSNRNVVNTHLGGHTSTVHIIELGHQISLEVYVLYLIWGADSAECRHLGCQQVHEEVLKWAEYYNITRGISEHIYIYGSAVHIKLPKYLTLCAKKYCLWLSDLSNT